MYVFTYQNGAMVSVWWIYIKKNCTVIRARALWKVGQEFCLLR